MNPYDNCSRVELIRRIEELEGRADEGVAEQGRFREHFARMILDSLPDMLTILDRKGRIVEVVSSEQTNHVGFALSEIVGKEIRTILSTEACRNVSNNLDNVFATGVSSMSHHDITLDGQTRNYENRIIPLDHDNSLCICRDITDSEAAKHELELVKYALNNVEEEIFSCDLDGTMEYANEQFRARHDLRDEIASHKVYEFWTYSGSRVQWLGLLAKIRQENGTHKYTVRHKDESGSIAVWDMSSYIIYDNFRDREVVWFFGRDVTHRLIHENKVKEMNSILDSILNSIPVYLFVKDPGNEFRYLYWNQAFEDFSHIPAAKAMGNTDFDIFPSVKDAEKFRRDDLDLLRKGERVTFIEEYVSATGETRIVNTSKSLVPAENRLPLIIGVSWDITDQKNTEMEIVEARIRAEESDKLKSAFLANMSHEIRTPLNAIVGFAKLLSSAEGEEEKRQFTEIIDTNSDLLLQLINDILDLSKIEAGTLEFRPRPMQLNDLCRSEYEVHKGRVQPGVRLVYEENPNDMEIVCDQNRLAQVLTNLINNASKFTTQGEIRFGYTLREGFVDFYVEDTGMGIPPERVDQIFTRFVKLNDFALGTGLGLAISKMIIEHMAGTIGVESEQGQGTRFYFTIPTMAREMMGAHSITPVDQQGSVDVALRWNLLVVDDSDTTGRLVEAISGRRFNLISARNGVEAVELFERTQPDVVLVDMHLSVMSGIDTVRAIRRLSPDVPILAMSSNLFGNEIDEAKAAGCQDFLVKPLSQFALNKALNACLISFDES